MISPVPKMLLFPVLRCNQACAYCINHHGDFTGSDPSGAYVMEPGERWVEAIAGLRGADEVCFLGGEPALHPAIATMVDAVVPETRAHVSTNGSAFSVARLVKIRREENIWVQVSFHPTQVSAAEFVGAVAPLVERFAGRIGIHSPDVVDDRDAGLIEGLTGFALARNHLISSPETGAVQKHPSVDTARPPQTVVCPLNAWLPIAPDGTAYACHALMYAKSSTGKLGNFLDGTIPSELPLALLCSRFGRCNPCEVQRFTHVETTLAYHRSLKC